MDNNSESQSENREPKSQLKVTRTVWDEIYEWVNCAVITVVCILLVFTFVIRQVRIEGASMQDTLFDNERVVMTDVLFTPEYGDIVVISSEIYGNTPIIKRVIATEGQWVNIHDGSIFVGDTVDTMKAVSQEFIGAKSTDAVVGGGLYGIQVYPLQVPENHVFVLGDNRPVSLDSRTTEVGLVDERMILGKALYRVFPFNKIGNIYD